MSERVFANGSEGRFWPEGGARLFVWVLAAGVGLALVVGSRAATAGSPGDDNNAAVAALQGGDFDLAVRRLRSAHARDPANRTIKQNFLGALNAAAVAAMNAQRHEEAERLYREALALDGDDERTLRQYTAFLNNRAVLFMDRKRMEEARQFYHRALKYLPRVTDRKVVGQVKTNFANFLTAEGDAFVQTREFELARSRYRVALDYNPRNANALAGLGDIAYDQNACALALANYQKALAAATAAQRPQLLTDLRERIDTVRREMAIETDFLTIRDRAGRFELFFPKTLSKGLVAHVLQTLSAAYQRIGRDFAFYPSRPVTVKIYSREQLGTIQEVPPWVVGFFDGKLRLLDERLKSSTKGLRRSIYHEYTHAVVHLLGGEAVPSWLHEGLAQIEEPERPVTARDVHYVAVRVRTGQTVSFADLARPFKRTDPGDEMPLIYLQSRLLVHFLLETHEWETMRALLRETARLGDFDQALAATLGMTAAELEAAWKRWVLDNDEL